MPPVTLDIRPAHGGCSVWTSILDADRSPRQGGRTSSSAVSSAARVLQGKAIEYPDRRAIDQSRFRAAVVRALSWAGLMRSADQSITRRRPWHRSDGFKSRPGSAGRKRAAGSSARSPNAPAPRLGWPACRLLPAVSSTEPLLAGLRQDGMVAPAVFNGAINGELFLAYVEQVLAPSLRPGDTVVMDNLGSHKVAGVREAIAAAGASVLSCPLTAPTSTRSSRRSPSSRRCCAPRPSHRRSALERDWQASSAAYTGRGAATT